MSRKQQLAGLAVLGVLAAVWNHGHFAATARQPDEPSGAAKADIAVLDVARVFRENKRFARDTAALKKQVDLLDVEFRIRGQEIKRLQSRLEHVPAGTPEREKLGNEVIDKKAQMRADTEKQKEQLLQREALLYRKVYWRIAELTEAYATRHGIRLVVRFNSGSMESTDRKAILETVNRAIIFQDNLDITDAISDKLNAQGVPSDS